MPVDSPGPDTQPGAPAGPWHENTPVLLLHSPGAEEPPWHELKAQSFPSSSVFQSSERGVLQSSCYDDLPRSRRGQLAN